MEKMNNAEKLIYLSLAALLLIGTIVSFYRADYSLAIAELLVAFASLTKVYMKKLHIFSRAAAAIGVVFELVSSFLH